MNKNAVNERPLIGAIRWDAMGSDSFEKKSLSPLKFHDRVPFFLTINNENKVTGNENKQEIIDKEIIYAKEAGINYWAFITGCATNPNSMETYALDKYLKSPYKKELGFSLILHKYVNIAGAWEARVKKLVQMFLEPSYVKVNGRPMLYIFAIDQLEKAYGEGEGTEKALDFIRSETIKAGLKTPYIVAMCHGDLNKISAYINKYKLDALSAYIFMHHGPAREGFHFETLATKNAESWDAYKQATKQIIPCVTLGVDQRCRWLNPPPWGAFESVYYESGTPKQMAEHIKAGMQYVQNNAQSCEANSILIYAWNEYCEGGWLCPTHAQGTDRLDAIKEMLKDF